MKKFHEIYLDIKSKIEKGVYGKDSLLPGENKLAEEYSVSRETIRKSLRLLLENGYIQKKQGKGSIVLDIHKYSLPVTGLVSFKELKESQNIETTTEIVKNEIVKAPKFLVDLGLVDAEEKMIYLVRKRIIDKESVILDKDYINCNIVKKLPNKKMKLSMYDYLENELNINIAYAKKNVYIEKVTQEDINLLDVKDYRYVVVVKSEIYTEDAEFLHYTESRHRLDKFQFTEFARRQKS
ncbi:trehalose operon repressor [Gemelliphila palaticanis]|uniref:Trehalose operon repressor n=1 Tax=Gemelliphila palaticanis TaxID=81950 RepID=A0ABX2SZ05_9BACL|nr:trehalose operon repressor [Gemella palaticanis]MBF0715560.1 trehalose operon repressor [Gemella palaticanis]NYS47490.1 trehalose operon repressor [Gemella palaticanis]